MIRIVQTVINLLAVPFKSSPVSTRHPVLRLVQSALNIVLIIPTTYIHSERGDTASSGYSSNGMPALLMSVNQSTVLRRDD